MAAVTLLDSLHCPRAAGPPYKQGRASGPDHRSSLLTPTKVAPSYQAPLITGPSGLAGPPCIAPSLGLPHRPSFREEGTPQLGGWRLGPPVPMTQSSSHSVSPDPIQPGCTGGVGGTKLLYHVQRTYYFNSEAPFSLMWDYF